MRHHNVVRKFGRQTGQRKALLRSLALNLVNKGKIITTEAKAKELRPFIEKIITRGKQEDLSSKRLLASRLGDRSVVKSVTDSLSKKYKDRKGGYTRVVRLGQRKGDGSSMALVEFV